MNYHTLTHANVWESVGKPCSCTQFINNVQYAVVGNAVLMNQPNAHYAPVIVANHIV